ncbi:hypothetical protein BC835DRAFT_1290884 [Cytidiella melzeri]|nr:hypothetical protein BC835DRAFT_1290884 [Cytidiella melzeri]
MNVLVYTGPEVMQTSASRAISSLRSVLYPHYAVQAVSQQTLTSGPWSSSCALLVFPACRLPLPTSVASSIKSFVENGGAFLGLQAGMRAGSLLGAGGLNYSFRLQDPVSGSSLYCTFPSNEDSSPQLVPVSLRDEEVVSLLSQTKAVDFDGIERVQNARVVAHYPESKSIAAAAASVGSGNVVLWGPHLEVAISQESSGLSSDEAQTLEGRRQSMLRTTLSILGLNLPLSDPNSPLYPLPQFLLASRQGIVSHILEVLSVTVPGQFKDAHDTFSFHAAPHAETLLQQGRTANDPEEVRHIIAFTDGSYPSTNLTPRFDTAAYFIELASARGKTEHTTAPDSWSIGDALFYGEAVTSTQTLLDKNPRFLSLLPSPTLLVATHQLAGRGRGGNSWVSPTGCLQFSLRLRISLASFIAPRLVFIQYLFALAVVEACRHKGVLGERGSSVRIKWPNDVYIVGNEDSGRTTKVAGILVYTAFSGTDVDVVIGCGLNVLNPPPIASLASFAPEKKPTMERTLAILMTTFEAMWNTFIAGQGSFEPFMDLYLDRWLHSDQLVTLTTTTPHKRVRIVGITSDHGLLRTIPERGDYDGSNGFIDLQPDGNSFDLMAGLIMTKAR